MPKIAFLLLACAVVLFPLYWMIAGSFDVMTMTYRTPPSMFPLNPTVENYVVMFRYPVMRWAWNSFVVCGSVVTLSITVSLLGGYALEIKRFRGHRVVFVVLVATMLLSGQLSLIPTFRMMRVLGIAKNRLGLILPGILSISGIFIMRAYFQSFPREVLDAADVDGAREGWKLINVIVPLCKPVLATLAILGFMGTWNNLFWQSIVANNDRERTLLVGVAYIIFQEAELQRHWAFINYGLMMAGGVAVFIPMAIVFLFASRYFVGGIYIGRGKG